MKADIAQYLCELLPPRLEEFFEYLQVDFHKYNKYYIGQCPIHNGTNRRSCVVYPYGRSINCSWKCLSGGCSNQDKFGGNIFGLVRGIYHNQRQLDISYTDAIKIVQGFLRVSDDVDISKFNKKYAAFKHLTPTVSTKNTELNLSRSELRKRLTIPSPTFTKRGFHPNILDRFDIGDTADNQKLLNNRTILPIYDVDYTRVIGCQARTIFDDYQIRGIDKWKTVQSFSVNSHLFNFWFAKHSLAQKQTLILVESVTNALKLLQNGIENVVATFGINLTEAQEILLEQLLIRKIILIFDNDERKAGIEGAKRLKQQLCRLYQVDIVDIADYHKNDLTMFTDDEVLSLRERYSL